MNLALSCCVAPKTLSEAMKSCIFLLTLCCVICLVVIIVTLLSVSNKLSNNKVLFIYLFYDKSRLATNYLTSVTSKDFDFPNLTKMWTRQ